MLPLVFFENVQTTNQETHNREVNENHRAKHDSLIVRFRVTDVCSEKQMEVSIIWRNQSVFFFFFFFWGGGARNRPNSNFAVTDLLVF